MVCTIEHPGQGESGMVEMSPVEVVVAVEVVILVACGISYARRHTCQGGLERFPHQEQSFPIN